MATKYLKYFFEPKSIAVIGASVKEGKMGQIVLKNLVESDYQGAVYAVNKHRQDDILGVPTYKRIKSLPEKLDLAVVCTPPETLLLIMQQLVWKGVRAVMLLTGGLSRKHSWVDNNINLAVLRLAKAHNIRVIGPNTLGLMSSVNPINISYGHLPILPGSVAYVGQSGTVASSILDWAYARGFGFSHFINLDDRGDVDLADIVDYLSLNRSVKVIVLHVEDIKRPDKFVAAVGAAAKAKLVVAVRSGDSNGLYDGKDSGLAEGIQDSGRIYRQMFRRLGVMHLKTPIDLMESLPILEQQKRFKGHRLAILSNSIGMAMVASDRLYDQGRDLLANLSQETVAKLSKVLPKYWSHRNPVDLDVGASAEIYLKVAQIISADPNVDILMVLHVPSAHAHSMTIAEQLVEHCSTVKVPMLMCWVGESSLQKARDLFDEHSIPSFNSPEIATQAYRHAMNYHFTKSILRETPVRLNLPGSKEGSKKLFKRYTPGCVLNPDTMVELVKLYGFEMVDTVFADDIPGLQRNVEKLGFPVNLTLINTRRLTPFSYRDDPLKWRGCQRNVSDQAELKDAAETLLKRYQQHDPENPVLMYSAQKVLAPSFGLQFNFGVTRDEKFGPLIFFGAGGSTVNIRSDRQVAFPPLNMTLAGDLIRRSYVSHLLQENGGVGELQKKILAKALVSLSQMVMDQPTLGLLEISAQFHRKDKLVIYDASGIAASKKPSLFQGYPEQLIEPVVLKRSKTGVIIRPIRAEDAHAMIDFQNSISPEANRFRFFHRQARFSATEIARLTQIDYDREMAFVAVSQNQFGEDRIIGEVRTWTDPDNVSAEFAVMVRDDQKGEGLGVTLMNKMIGYCKQRKTLAMIGTVLPENSAMLRLAEKLGFESCYNSEEQVCELFLKLNRPSEDWQKVRFQALANG
ncbi:GNAT family N-acetyltransferase [Litoribacillus peritrichatus]|uniref:Bifunctional acetate--CoA ligase family protein/GNAT family N-acetyltransferase n=1 Tax=Litoribacillus peritrichatus TaxID=718191 RepID=A0ABP7NCE5_9GAMM